MDLLLQVAFRREILDDKASFDGSPRMWSCFSGFLKIAPEVTFSGEALALILEVTAIFCVVIVVPVERAQRERRRPRE